MKVTKLLSQKKDPSRVNIYIDGEFFCGLSLDSIAKFNIYVDRDIEGEELDEILFEELKNRFLTRAFSYISRSIRSEFQLRRYLKDLSIKKKGVWYSDVDKDSIENLVNEVVEKLKEYDYLDDERFAEEFILSRIKNKPRGKNILLSELMSKGINKEIALEKLEKLVEDEYDILRRVYVKKFREQKIGMRDNKKIDFLRRKGFNWDLIEKFINNESEE
jgi:regulatory protein